MLDPEINLRKIEILTIPSILIHERGLSIYLNLNSSQQYFVVFSILYKFF